MTTQAIIIPKILAYSKTVSSLSVRAYSCVIHFSLITFAVSPRKTAKIDATIIEITIASTNSLVSPSGIEAITFEDNRR